MTQHDLVVQPAAPTGLAAVGVAVRRALISQLHPKMLLAILLPFFVAVVGAILLLWLFWTPLTNWLDTSVLEGSYVDSVDAWLMQVGLFSVKLYLVPLLAALMLLPMAGILGLAVAAIFIMPMVLRHLETREYAGLVRKGSLVATYGWWNAIWVMALFVIGWVLTLPLWLIPPLALILPVFWWSFAFSRMLRVDALLEHADETERRYLWKRHNRQYWLLGLLLALLNLFPLTWLILPTLSALVFAHFSLEALRQLRALPVAPQAH
ncbi:EI24 domain-containing protein [Pusillimonas sp. CC-YST705]|uniref:EI24 domain-containing protein n=1 Tax=Mesopusillimonas faecipullorum TaxID=2755040 RepID=A0ABS8C841_9BURK|nr:EI24 domain-containing protein [Mesopusillimonas faecipullorum]MCB5362193.1 EI24 domain-containing protein [Mesopusillimonas faecipullorum]